MILRVRDNNGNVIDVPAIVGPQGPQGPEGPRGFSGVAVQTTGYVAFNVTEDGMLQCSYTGDAQPNYYINEEGHLCFDA